MSQDKSVIILFVMENNPVQNIPTPTSQPHVEPAKSSNPKGLLISLVVLEIITLLVAGYFGYQYNQLKKQTTTMELTSTSTVNTPFTTTDPSVGQIASLPSGWEYKLSQQQNNANDCVKFALPPMVEPYVYMLNENRQPSVTEDKGSGRFWYIGGGAYPNLLSKILAKGQEYKQTMAIFATEMEASGYISQAVEVSCVDNLKKIDNTTLLKNLETNLAEFNKSAGEKGMEANRYTILTSKNNNRWGKNVVDLTISEYFENSGGQPYTNSVDYTILATPQFLYEVRVLGASNDTFVKETAQKIFNSLLFD